MANLNRVFLIGNLTRDPELRYTPQGKAVITLRIAVNTNFKNQNGEKKQETCFINIIAVICSLNKYKKIISNLINRYNGRIIDSPVIICYLNLQVL